MKKEQKKVGNYSLFQEFSQDKAEAAGGPLSAANPPLPHRLSAVFCTGISQQIRGFSGVFHQLFRADFNRNIVGHFPQRFRSHSGGISRLVRREKWRKAGGEGDLRKSASFFVDR